MRSSALHLTPRRVKPRIRARAKLELDEEGIPAEEGAATWRPGWDWKNLKHIAIPKRTLNRRVCKQDLRGDLDGGRLLKLEFDIGLDHADVFGRQRRASENFDKSLPLIDKLQSILFLVGSHAKQDFGRAD